MSCPNVPIPYLHSYLDENKNYGQKTVVPVEPGTGRGFASTACVKSILTTSQGNMPQNIT
jgi:hypothetical protein